MSFVFGGIVRVTTPPRFSACGAQVCAKRKPDEQKYRLYRYNAVRLSAYRRYRYFYMIQHLLLLLYVIYSLCKKTTVCGRFFDYLVIKANILAVVGLHTTAYFTSSPLSAFCNMIQYPSSSPSLARKSQSSSASLGGLIPSTPGTP